MRILLVIIGGASALFLGMGVARFAFTPMLPIMQMEFYFSDGMSGALASINYLGYLIGAFSARYISGKKYAYSIFIFSLPISIILIGLMWYEIEILWYFLRFISGIFSAILLVLGADFVINFLIKEGKSHLSGMIFSGIGMGMVLSGLTVPLLSKYYSSSQIWLWLSALSVVPAFVVFITVPKPAPSIVSAKNEAVVFDKKRMSLLYTAYALEGFGYIITGTFISVMMLRTTNSVMLSGYIWLIAGLAAVIITPIWPIYAKRVGSANALFLLYILQAVAVASPVIIPTTVSAFIGAVGYGGTFLGIVTLAFVYGKEISNSSKTTAVLTLFFSIGQVLGPFIAGRLADLSGGFKLPIIIASISIFVGGIIILFSKGAKYADN